MTVEEEKSPAAAQGRRWDWVTWVMLGVMAAFVCVAFSPAIRATFIDLDDGPYAYANPQVLGGLSPHAVKWALTTREDGRYMPVTWLSLELDGTISNALGLDCAPGSLTDDHLPDAVVFHVTNIVLHVAATWALFLFVKRATKHRWASFVITLLWCVHPLRVESVAWVTERKDELAGLFGFLSMYWYVIGKEEGRGRWWFWGSCAALVLSMWAKAMFTTMPLLLMIVDYWPLGRIRSVREAVRSLVEKWPMWVVVILGAIGTMLAGRGSNMTLGSGHVDDARNAILSYVRYLPMQVDFRGLAPYYPYVGSPTGLVCAAAALLAALTAAAYLLRKKYPWLLVGWLWYVISFLPMIGFVQSFTQAYADRFAYLPAVGLLMIVVFAAFQWRRGTPVIVGAALALAVVLMVVSFRQTEYWQNSVTLFEHNRAVTPPSEVVHYCLGHGYNRAGRLAEAEQEYVAVIEEMPAYVDARLTLASVYLRDKQIDKALEQEKKSAQLDPENFHVCRMYGSTLLMAGQYAAAAAQLEKAAKMRPEDEAVQENLRAARAGSQ